MKLLFSGIDSKKKLKGIYHIYNDLNVITPTKKKPVIRWEVWVQWLMILYELICRCLSACLKGIASMFGRFRRCLNLCVDHSIFQQGILLCIFINTFSMGIEYHDQPETLTKVVEVSNLVFSCIFTVEMLLKLTAYGFVQYVSDGFNVFDGFIVCLG